MGRKTVRNAMVVATASIFFLFAVPEGIRYRILLTFLLSCVMAVALTAVAILFGLKAPHK